MAVKRKLRQEIENIFRRYGGEIKVVLEKPENELFGDLTTNAALVFFKKNKGNLSFKNPQELAQAVAARLNKKAKSLSLEKVVAQGGFLNFYFSQDYLLRVLGEILDKKDKFGQGKEGQGKTVVIDYSSPNIAKPFGIGHLRSTIIGQALYNLYQFLGYRVVGDNHLGDWGTQFGKLIYQIKEKGLDPQKLTIAELEKLYIQFHRQAEKKPSLEKKARFWFKKLEEGDAEARSIWESLVKISLKEFNRVYKLLDVSFDVVLGESFYSDKMEAVVAEARKKGILKKSRGAWVIPLPGIKVPAMLIKSDGATTYLLRDLAALRYRRQRWHPVLVIYEVGADQRFHFRQVFAAAQALGYFSSSQLVHVAHGMIRGLEGKFSTRQGKTIHLEAVLGEAIKRAEKIAQEAGVSKELSSRQRQEALAAIGIGAVKYNDLKQRPTNDIIFDWEKILTLKGNSGPYLQYTVARAQGIIQKAGKINIEKIPNYQPNNDELSILRLFCQFSDTISLAAHLFSPHLLAHFLFSLAQKYNAFYDRYSVLQAETPAARSFRLQLTAATAQVLKNGLRLLGIKPLERM